MIRSSLSALALSALFAFTPAQVQAQTPASGAADATAPIARLNTALINAMRAGKATPFEQRYQGVAPAVEQAFDLQAVLEAAVGLRWKDLPPDQQQQLLSAFTRFTVSTFVANFDSYGGQKLVVEGTHMLGAQTVVDTKLVPPSGDATQFDYVMRQEPTGWRAVDVLLDGSISRAAVMRSDFRSLLSGGNAGPLIQNLQKKSADLANGVQH